MSPTENQDERVRKQEGRFDMSAENELVVFKMINGEIWIATRSCGDVSECIMYQVGSILGKALTYESGQRLFDATSDPDSSVYAYTEYGGHYPSREELRAQKPHYLQGSVTVRVMGRDCMCLDKRDLEHRRWEVVEMEEYVPGMRRRVRQRTLRQNMGYTEALTFAHMYQIAQPGDMKLVVPTLFWKVKHYEPHDCDGGAEGNRWGENPLDVPVERWRRRFRRR